MPPRRKPEPAPPAAAGPSVDDIVGTMLRRILDVRSGDIYQIDDHWPNGRVTNIRDEHMYIMASHAAPAVDMGFIEVEPNVSPRRYRLTPAGVRYASTLIGRTPYDVKATVEGVLDTVLFGPSDAIEGRTAIPAIYSPSSTNSKLVLVLGENAAGKSLFRRIVQMLTHRGRPAQGMGEPAIERGEFPVHEMLHFSMQSRAGEGFGKSFVYGTEDYHSTGENSAHTIEGAFRTALGRNHTTILYWDEPDIGMSAGASAGAGVAIRDFILNDVSPLSEAMFLTSHSVPLVRQLVDLDPHYLFLGNPEGPKTLADWFNWQLNPPPISPSDLKELSHRRFGDIQKVLNGRKVKK